MAESRLTLRRAFVADHFHDLPGFVEARHGHDWVLEASVQGTAAETETRLAAGLDAWIASVDSTVLNVVPRIAHRNPTAETLAQLLLEDLEQEGFTGVIVRMREKANYWASCRRCPA